MFVRCFYPTFTSDSEWEQILGYGFDFPNGSNGMPGRVGKSRGRSLHGLMQSSQMMLRKWDIHPNFPEFLVLSTTRPRFSIIFHHFPSFSIIFPRKYPDALEMRGKVEEMGGTTLLTVDATKLHKVMLGTTGGCRSCVGHPLERNVYEI